MSQLTRHVFEITENRIDYLRNNEYQVIPAPGRNVRWAICTYGIPIGLHVDTLDQARRTIAKREGVKVKNVVEVQE